MIFTLTDRHYNVLDAYETDDYLIGQYIGSILETLEINVLVKSLNAEHWVEGNYIMCQDKRGKKRWFTIYDCEDSHGGDVKSLFCYSGTIDIVAEDAPQISASEAKPFKWYFDQIFYDTGIELGINEISDLTRKLEFTSENASNAEMLQYVLNGFDNAEASLDVEFDGATPTKLVLNVYKRIGNEEPQAILSDEDDSLTSLDRKGSISDLATCINPTGAEDENGNTITLLGKYYEEKDEQGNILYYSPVDSPRVFSVVARQNFYVQLPGKANGEFDGYINRRYESQATTQDTLWQESLAQLKKIDHVAVTYEANGYIDCSIGDNVQIVSHEMKPPVMIAARTIEYKFNDDDPTKNVYKFGNYVELTSNLDELSKIIAEVKKQVEPQVIEAERNAKFYAEIISAEKAAQAEENAKGYTDTVKVGVVKHANTVANQAENNAKSHADTVAGTAESNAKAYALSEADKARIAAIQAAATDAQTKVNAAKTALEASIAEKADAEWVNGQLVKKVDADIYNTKVKQLTDDIAKKAGLEYVNGQLVSKADKNNTYTKTEVDNALNSKVSNTTYTADKDGIVTKLENHESRIVQTENGLLSKVESTTYTQKVSELETNIGKKADTSKVSALETRMNTAETSISQQASQIALKANQATVDTLTGRVDSAESQLTVQAGQIASKVDKTSYDTDKKGIITRLNSAESRITQTEKAITLKVNQTTYDKKVTELTNSLSQKETPAGAQAKADAAKNAAISYADTKVGNVQVGGRNLLRNSNDFTNLGKFSGAQYSYKTDVAVSEWNATDATEIHVTGGNNAVKLTNSIVAPSIAEQEYTLSVWLKNIGKYPIIISANIPGKEETVNPGESKRVIVRGKGDGKSNFQLNIKTSQENIDKPLDFIIWRCQGERGNVATDWTQALEDVEAKITAVETRMSAAETNIQQTASDISLKANKTDVYTKTEVNNALANKADNNRVATVESRVTRAEASIKTQADAIALRALKTDVYTKTEADGKISTAVNNAKADIKLTTDSISQSVSSLQSTVSGHGTRLNSAESSITSLSTQIQSKVTMTEVNNAVNNAKRHPDTRNNNQPPSWYWTNFPRQSIEEFKLTSVVGAPKGETYGTLITVVPWTDSSGGAIKQTFRTGQYNFERVSNGTSAWTAWIELENTAGSQAKVNSLKTDEIEPLKTRVSSAESTITQQAGLIASKAESSTVTALGARVTTAEQNINGLTGQISQKVSKTDYNGNTIASLINQTATTIKLQAAKIALDGYVEAKHIKSLNGLNVGNGQFIVDKNGNVKFAGNLEGASGTFNGALTTNHLEIGPSSPDFPWYSDGSGIVSVLEMKNPVRISDGVYGWGPPFQIKLLGNNNGVRISYPGGLYVEGSLLVEENRVQVDRQTQLWRGTAFMMASQTAKPSKKLRECNQGWVLVWQEYTSNGESNSGWQYTYIPKFVVNVHEGQPISIPLAGYDGAYCRKILYVYDDRITGHNQNGMYTPATLSLSHIFEF